VLLHFTSLRIPWDYGDYDDYADDRVVGFDVVTATIGIRFAFI
jgi:hypothetical protein